MTRHEGQPRRDVVTVGGLVPEAFEAMTRRTPIRFAALAILVALSPLAACSDDTAAPPGPAEVPPAPDAASTAPAATTSPAATAPEAASLLTPDAEVVIQRGGLFLGGASGADLTPVTGASGAEHPDWSPDGARLVFETEFKTLWVGSADAGAAPTELLTCDSPCVAVYDGAWSPDGTEIAFVVMESDDAETTARASIRVIEPATGAVRTAYTDDTGEVWLYQPRWSPDGAQFVVDEATFASNDLDEEAITQERIVIVAADDTTTSPIALTDNTGRATSPDWSSLGDHLVYSQRGNLWLVRPDGTDRRQLTSFDGSTEQAIQPTFLPDGSGVVFTYVTGDGSAPMAAVIALDGTGFEVIDLGGPATHVRIRPT